MRKYQFVALLGLLILGALVPGCSERDDIAAPIIEEAVLVNPVIDLLTNPLGAEVKIFQPDMSKQDDPLGMEIFSGTTPIFGLELEPGSYVAQFSAEDYDSKLLGLRLAYGDTNISKTVDLQLTPADPPEYEDPSGHLAFSSNPAALDDTVGVTVTINSGALGILSMGGQTYFSYAGGAYVFPFEPETSGEHIVSLLIIGEGGDFLPINEFLTVLPAEEEHEEVTLNAWIVGDDTVPADSEVHFGWAASANADSVTTNGYYTDGNIGLGDPNASMVILQDTILELFAWKDGEIRDQKSLEFFVEPPVTAPRPEVTFYASAYEVESSNPAWSEYQVVEGQEIWLVWNIKYYDESRDEVWLDAMPTQGDLGPRGLMPTIVSSDTTFTLGVDRDDQESTSKMVRITVVPGPIESVEYFDIRWHVDGWVGQRSQDPHQIDLMSGIYLPENIGIGVYARLGYSSAGANQDDESCAIGFLTTMSEHWAYLDDPDCPVFPDQGEDVDEMFYVGLVSDFSDEDGRLVMQTGADFDCWDTALKCVNPNSVHVSEVLLRVYLQ